MGLTISISLGGLIIIAIIVALVLRHRRKIREAEIEAENRIVGVSADDIAEKHVTGLLGRQVMIGSTIFDVIGLDKHSLVDDDLQPDDDEYWFVLTCRDSIGQKTVHLSCEQDDEGVWEFLLFEEVDKTVRMKIPALANISFDGDGNAPPRQFEYDFLTWSVLRDDNGTEEYDYTVHVHSTHKDRPDRPREYLTQVTEYASDVGDRLMYLELWDTSARNARKGGGVSMSIGRELLDDEVDLFPKGKN